jgi:amino acid transporter
MSVGWIVVSFFTLSVATGMAEIVSAIPTAGGPYYWAAILAPANHSAFASWVTGWFVPPPLHSPQFHPEKNLIRPCIGSISSVRLL